MLILFNFLKLYVLFKQMLIKIFSLLNKFCMKFNNEGLYKVWKVKGWGIFIILNVIE